MGICSFLGQLGWELFVEEDSFLGVGLMFWLWRFLSFHFGCWLFCSRWVIEFVLVYDEGGL